MDHPLVILGIVATIILVVLGFTRHRARRALAAQRKYERIYIDTLPKDEAARRAEEAASDGVPVLRPRQRGSR